MHFEISGPTPSYPPAGNVVSVVTHILWRHKGVVSDRRHNGKPMVISASARAGCVREESWDVFACGNPVRNDGYPSQLPRWEVLHRAHTLIGTPYRLFDLNCDHFVALAHGEEQPQSSQLGATIAIALAVVGMSALIQYGRFPR